MSLVPCHSGSGRRSFDRSRVIRARLILPRPGGHTLQIEGLEPGQHSGDWLVVFMCPDAAALVLNAVGLVRCGLGVVGGLAPSILGLALR